MYYIGHHTALYGPCDTTDPRDPACPYDEDFTPEDEEELWEREVDREIDRSMERLRWLR